MSDFSAADPSQAQPLVFDAHLDLSMNAMEWNRDLTRSLEYLRRREQHQRDQPDRGNGIAMNSLGKGMILSAASQVAERLAQPAMQLPKVRA